VTRALLVRTTGAYIIEVEPNLEGIRNAIGGGWLEGVSSSIDDDWHAYCDEEGKLKGLPPNLAATMLLHSLGWPKGDILHGHVIIFGERKVEEGVDEADVPDRVLALARSMGLL